MTDEQRKLTPRQQARWRTAFGSALREGWVANGNPNDAETLRDIEREARTVATETVLGLR